MMPFEFRSPPRLNAVEVWAGGDAPVAVVQYDNARADWLAEIAATGQRQHLGSFGAAVNFIEATLQTGAWLTLRSPDLTAAAAAP